jgi:flagellar basal-body rod modification protein FlgD
MATTDGVGSTTQTSSTGTAAAKKSLADNFDAFLTLLTKQLQNQDPLKPMDSNEFTQQLVQYSAVEQAIKQNENLESMLALLKGQQTLDYVSMIGKEITYLGDDATLGATGGADWKYEVGAATTTATIQVLDATGKVVYQTTVTPKTGINDFEWDGKKTDGTRAAEGSYTMKVTGLDKDGKSTTALIYATGLVSGIETDSDGTSLVVGPYVVAPSDVRAVNNPVN